MIERHSDTVIDEAKSRVSDHEITLAPASNADARTWHECALTNKGPVVTLRSAHVAADACPSD
jgi:hypothetical protein